MPQLSPVGFIGRLGVGRRRAGTTAPVSGAFDAMQALQAAYGLYGVQRLVSSHSMGEG